MVLLRHGQSVWNLEDRFTGRTDVDLFQTKGFGMTSLKKDRTDKEPGNKKSKH